jgi:predicted N-acetyltransferase YhbS
VTLTPVTTEDYVRDVLPETFALWGGGRDFAHYADDYRALAASPFCRGHELAVGMREGGTLVASCKLFRRELRAGNTRLRATGIGAVFTPTALRGRGYATAMLAMVMDRARAAGRDIAFLYSDLHPAFYERLGFVALPSRRLTLGAASLSGSRSGAVTLEPRDWTALRHCFDDLDARGGWGFTRTAAVWDWMHAKWTAPPLGSIQRVHLGVRRGRKIIAYVLGQRIPREDLFFVEEFAFTGDKGRAAVGPLLRAAAGDLRRVRGWMPPPHARGALPRGSTTIRKNAIFMLVPLSPRGRTWWSAAARDTLGARGDPVWTADHV